MNPIGEPDESPADDRQRLFESRLYKSGGFLVVTGLIAGEALTALAAEAAAARSAGARSFVLQSDAAEDRGGSPARAYRSAPGGSLHWQLHGSLQMVETLGRLCRLTLGPTGGGTFSYYEQQGDFLALHRDVFECDVALITCLTHTARDGQSGGLLVYPHAMLNPLSKVRANADARGMLLRVAPGETIILLGGMVPHEVVPLSAGEERIVAIMCYRIE